MALRLFRAAPFALLCTVPMPATAADQAVSAQVVSGRAASDFRPLLVRRGDPVRIRIDRDGIRISAEGRALSHGAAGERIRVFSAATNRTLVGRVIAPDLVTIDMP